MGFIGKSVLLTLFALCFFTSSALTSEVTHALPPIKLPSLPPTKLPSLPPTKLPTLPPTKLPTLPPAKAPIKLPTLPPTKLPSLPPVLPPVYPPKFNRNLVAVWGFVCCKSCKYAGINPLLGAKPVKGIKYTYIY
ncbi:unnamed protein product [Arabis nemorensis]|uniref:Uncharacterized protein n=1 Tax=Arabis nemorensis TaxID=586526 RepID=A0A565BMC5_9BRAS|nr:unnamed protein product [Arabis nemorensis]